MQIQDAAKALEISPRTLRHYEAKGLLTPGRDGNGYRSYAPADLRRAARIRDMIATGYSTREIRALAPCLDDANAGACHDAVAGLLHKLQQIEKLMAELSKKRQAVMDELDSLAASLGQNNQASEPVHERLQTPVSFSDRLSGRG